MSIFQILEKRQKKMGHHGSVWGWKNGLRGQFNPVRLGQVRIAKKSFKN
jgi:hypothetical protein